MCTIFTDHQQNILTSPDICSSLTFQKVGISVLLYVKNQQYVKFYIILQNKLNATRRTAEW